jgi:hypothetical protein
MPQPVAPKPPLQTLPKSIMSPRTRTTDMIAHSSPSQQHTAPSTRPAPQQHASPPSSHPAPALNTSKMYSPPKHVSFADAQYVDKDAAPPPVSMRSPRESSNGMPLHLPPGVMPDRPEVHVARQDQYMQMNLAVPHQPDISPAKEPHKTLRLDKVVLTSQERVVGQVHERQKQEPQHMQQPPVQIVRPQVQQVPPLEASKPCSLRVHASLPDCSATCNMQHGIIFTIMIAADPNASMLASPVSNTRMPRTHSFLACAKHKAPS